MTEAARALAEAADSLGAAAAVHKRSAAAHRRALRRCLDAKRQVDGVLRDLGLDGSMVVEISTEIEGDPSGSSNDTND